MLKISFEFRKGIFFLRFIGELNKETYQKKDLEIKELLIQNNFKYIVINTNHLNKIDLTGLNYLLEICYLTKEIESNLVICDRFNIVKRLLKTNVPNIKEEIEVL